METLSQSGILVQSGGIPFLRELYSRLLSRVQIRICATPEEARRIISQSPPAVFVCALTCEDFQNGIFTQVFNLCHFSGTQVFLLAERFESADFRRVFDFPAVLCVPKSVSIDSLTTRIEELLCEREKTERLRKELKKSNDHSANFRRTVISTLTLITEFRDSDTAGHVKRTTLYVSALIDAYITKGYGIDPVYAENIKKTASLHDIGKVTVSDILLKKPGKFTFNEYELTKLHTVYGNKILNNIVSEAADPMFRVAAEIAYTHHERWDGKGYPNGVSGEQIPLSGRIMAIADVYDALRSDRVYKKGFSHKKTTGIIMEDKETAFDPRLVDLFFEINEQFHDISVRFRLMKLPGEK
ncbi:MAG: HD domain-containing protein [Oscillospiraceae bacterium]|jgi:response regulator RpfG family c-di-GMP phosphodiesterase|nr:HD domain-containing protein [Oscillospiraceae bacterium]